MSEIIDSKLIVGGERLLESELTGKIINTAIAVHRDLGPGLLESAYHACLCREFSLQSMSYNPKSIYRSLIKGRHLTAVTESTSLSVSELWWNSSRLKRYCRYT
jgi:hypothetical protein